MLTPRDGLELCPQCDGTGEVPCCDCPNCNGVARHLAGLGF